MFRDISYDNPIEEITESIHQKMLKEYHQFILRLFETHGYSLEFIKSNPNLFTKLCKYRSPSKMLHMIWVFDGVALFETWVRQDFDIDSQRYKLLFEYEDCVNTIVEEKGVNND